MRVRLSVNGEDRDVPEGTTVSGLLEVLGMRRQGIAVEVNLAIVPRDHHQAHELCEGDSVEIVTFVGGG